MAKSVPIKTANQASKARQKARVEAFYQRAYETLRAVMDLGDYSSFEKLPRKGKVLVDVQNIGTQRKPKYSPVTDSGYKFTSEQKALLTKLSTVKPTSEQLEKIPELKRVNRRQKTNLFNSADAVVNNNYTLIKLNKNQRKKFLKNENMIMTNKGLILKSKTTNYKIEKLGDGLAVSFIPWVEKQFEDSRGHAYKEMVEAKNRKEIYVPIPKKLYGHFGALQAYHERISKISKAHHFTLAINTFHGKTEFVPQSGLTGSNSINDKFDEAFGAENPFVTGFYLILYKTRDPSAIIKQINDDETVQDIIGDPERYDADDF